MRQTVHVLAAFALLAGWASTAWSGTVVYDTTPYWDGSTAIAPWGSVQSGYTPTYGQTFYAPAPGGALQSFTFYITDLTPGDTLTFQAAVYAWSGPLLGGDSPQGATGTALFTSPNMTFTDDGAFQAVTINTGGINLLPGAAYVALFTTSDPSSIAANGNSLGLFEWGLTGYYVHQPSDGGGGFAFFNNLTSSQLNTVPWDDGSDLGDSAWTAVITTVPQPSSLSLLVFGVSGVVIYGWRLRTRFAPSRPG